MAEKKIDVDNEKKTERGIEGESETAATATEPLTSVGTLQNYRRIATGNREFMLV